MTDKSINLCTSVIHNINTVPVLALVGLAVVLLTIHKSNGSCKPI